jgi:two-component system, OmpR family, manganese sensing sensor histidine kinase
MFQATRQRLALWYTAVTAVLLLLFATGFYLYVRTTLVERIDDTLNHVVEVVQRSLVIDDPATDSVPPRLNVDATFRPNVDAVEDDHIDLEWFSPTGELLWSTLTQPLDIPVEVNDGETVHIDADQLLRQVTQRVMSGRQVLGYLRVSHPWFEVTKPSRLLIRDLALGGLVTIGAVAAIGWLLSGLAIAPVKDSYQRLKQFTADASHELRNPLAVIQTNVQVALADPDPQLQQQQLRVVERLTRRLGRLVDDLLFLARQDSSITALKQEPLALDDLVKEVAEEQRLVAAEKDIVVTVIPSESVTAMMVQGNRDQLGRLLTNLISNAIQYTPAGGEVQVSLARSKPNDIQIAVKDNGIGIPAESIPQLFERFYRVDVARSSSKAGSGLGLAIAKVIVDNHQGHIHVESELGKGTTFLVTFPSHRSEPTART